MDALAVLADYLSRAAGAGASSLLLVANQPPGVRVGGEIQTPFGSVPLPFRTTEAFALAVLDAVGLQLLDRDGSVEVPFEIAGVGGMVTVFYGGGCHNLVFRLGSTGGPDADAPDQSTPAHDA
ncbi:MAG: hypothetical protein N2111_07915 [Candidatus Sumerlaeaceae bacterium]|nr:hypothetical protein [Candidatus Sumerlaeaceae bacterium]